VAASWPNNAGEFAMENTLSLELRMADLEKEVAALKLRFAESESKTHWIDRIAGSFQGDPDFLEILRLGREFRDSDRAI
jgi:hypothetical protein